MREQIAVANLSKNSRAIWSALNEEEVQVAAEKYPNRIYFFQPVPTLVWSA